MERERVYGPGHFASSQMSLMGRDDTQPSAQPIARMPSKVNGKQATPQSPTGEAQGAKADYNMALPRLPAPASTHYSDMSYQAPDVVPSPTAPAFNAPQPRARDAGSLAVPKRGEEEKGEGAPAPTSAPPTPAKTALPRTPPAMTHRRSHSLSQRPSTGHMFKGLGERFMGGTLPEREIPATAGPEVTTFAEKMGEPSEKQAVAEEATKEKTDLAKPPEKAEQEQESPHIPGANLVRKFGTLLGAGREYDSRRGKRTSILGLSPRASRDETEQEKASQDEARGTMDQKKEDTSTPLPGSQSQPVGSMHRRAQTILDPAGRAARHERRVSAGASLLAAAHGSIGRQRRPSTSTGGTPVTPSKNKGAFDRTEEEDEREVNEADAEHVDGVKSDDDQDRGADKEFKPLFLKGLFR